MQKMNCYKKIAAQLMLVLATLQFVFVAFEAAGVMHGLGDSNIHHEEISAAHQAEPICSDVNQNTDPANDLCDHCCHCHGHGTHFSLLTQHEVFVTDLSSSSAFTYSRHFESGYVHSIHRPPIA